MVCPIFILQYNHVYLIMSRFIPAERTVSILVSVMRSISTSPSDRLID